MARKKKVRVDPLLKKNVAGKKKQVRARRAARKKGKGVEHSSPPGRDMTHHAFFVGATDYKGARKELKELGVAIERKIPRIGYFRCSCDVERFAEVVKQVCCVSDVWDVENKVSIPPPGVLNRKRGARIALTDSTNLINQDGAERFPELAPGRDVPLDGRGVTVAVVDTGIAPHRDLGGRIRDGKDFTGTGSHRDDNGHGTHVAGIVGARGESVRGVAPGASFLSVKVLDGQGSGSFEGVIDGIMWAVEQGADVLNLSLGGGHRCGGGCPVCRSVTWASGQGAVVCVAAGNSGLGRSTVECPGAARGILTVGAVTKNRKIAGFSSRGPTADGRAKPDVVAPGVNITSLSHLSGNGYVSKSGTSMAAPHVAGAAALLLQFSREEGSPADGAVVAGSLEECVKLPRYGPNSQGRGLINLVRAKRALERGGGAASRKREQPAKDLPDWQGETGQWAATAGFSGGRLSSISLFLILLGLVAGGITLDSLDIIDLVGLCESVSLSLTEALQALLK